MYFLILLEYIQDEDTYTTKIIEDNIHEINHQISPTVTNESIPTIPVTTPHTQSSHLFTPVPSITNQSSAKQLSYISATSAKKNKSGK